MASYSHSQDRAWGLWEQFCAELCVNPELHDIQAPLPLLQVFARRVRDGRSSASHRPVKSATVDNSLRAIGQKITMLGSKDPRLDAHGKIDIRLRRQSAYYAKADPPPARVLPIPIEIIQHAAERVYSDPHSSSLLQATADLITTAFYFLMRNGEYCTITDTDGYHPFCIRDITFSIGTLDLNSYTNTDAELLSATHVTIEFTKQKNAHRGEKVSQATSGHLIFCPCRALARRIICL